MDEHKVKNFHSDYPDAAFPDHVLQSTVNCARLVERLGAKLELQVTTGGDVVAGLRAADSRCFGQVPETTRFDFIQIVESCGAQVGSTVLVNWDDFQTVEAFLASELAAYFDYVWYPSVDDIEILDESCLWTLCVDHSGGWRLIVFDRKA